MRQMFFGLLVLTSAFLVGNCGAPKGNETNILPATESSKSQIDPIAITPTDKSGKESFSLDSANAVHPDDILNEVLYFGGGGSGWGWCVPGDTPAPCYPPSRVVWPNGFCIQTQNWKAGEKVKVLVTFPDGTTLSQDGNALESLEYIPTLQQKRNITEFSYCLNQPASKMPAGKYQVVFEGETGRSQVDVQSKISPIPNMYWDRLENNLIITGFRANEKIRLFLYDITCNKAETYCLTAWKEYQTNQEGQLIISVPPIQSAEYYVAVGDSSGLVEPNQILRQSIRVGEKEYIPFGECIGDIPPRLWIGEQGRVAFTDSADMRIRKEPGLSQNIVGKVPEGTKFNVLYGPVCVDYVTWWKVRANGLEGWMAEAQNGAYLLEPAP